MNKQFRLVAVLAGLMAAATFTQADHHEEGEKKGLSHEKMEEIMKVGFKSDKRKGTVSILDKIKDGTASKEESKKFLGMLLALETHKVEQGDQKEFNEKTDALVVAMAGVIAKKDGAVDALKTAANCKACHDAHKP